MQVAKGMHAFLSFPMHPIALRQGFKAFFLTSAGLSLG